MAKKLALTIKFKRKTLIRILKKMVLARMAKRAKRMAKMMVPIVMSKKILSKRMMLIKILKRRILMIRTIKKTSQRVTTLMIATSSLIALERALKRKAPLSLNGSAAALRL